MTIQELAKQAAEWFEVAHRPLKEGKREGDPFVRVKKGAPEWLTDLVKRTHDDCDILPDDYRYQYTSEALDLLAQADADAGEDDLRELGYEIEPDVYNSDLLAWVASHVNRSAYVDEAVREGETLDLREFELFEALRQGQQRERVEVFEAVLAFLRDRAAELDDAQAETEETEG